jgi:GAF domain-containing protein/AmiR/NasT family two-component response regulator
MTLQPSTHEELTARIAALEQEQAAVTEVLRIISNGSSDLSDVFAALLERAATLCGAEGGMILLEDGDVLRLRASFSPPGEQSFPSVRHAYEAAPITRDLLAGRAVSDTGTVAFAGTREEYLREFPATVVPAHRSPGPLARIAAPIMRGDEAIGVFNLGRQGERPFTADQIALVEIFAGQAAVAIENARLFAEAQDRNAELAESLEREQATAEVLRVISRSPEQLDESLQAVADAAAHLCRADIARVLLRDGDYLVPGPSASPSGLDDYRPASERDGRRGPIAKLAGIATFEAARTGQTVHYEDALRGAEERGASAQSLEGVKENINRTGLRTRLAVPLLLGNTVVGVLGLYRAGEPRPFSEREVALAETFADQAVIAIENARLFEELGDSLARQTATADVLQVISRSPVDLDGALNTIIERAVTLGEADSASLWLVEGDEFVRRASNLAGADTWRVRLSDAIEAGTPMGGRDIPRQRIVHVPDTEAADPSEFPRMRDVARRQGFRATLSVPLLREGVAIGTLNVNRAVARAFSEAQIALIQTFADQAVIAIENARLFAEVEERNRDLTDSLEQQTAVANVLEAISRTPVDREGSLKRIVDAAARLIGAERAVLHHVQEDTFTTLYTNSPHANDEQRQSWGTYQPGPPEGSAIWAAVTSAQPVQCQGTPDEIEAEFPQLAGWRREQGLLDPVSHLWVPLLTAAGVIGTIGFIRDGREPYTDAAIALATTFADQAAIAIENARLFREQQEAVAQLTASAEVLEMVSRSPRDLDPVFQKIAELTARLCDADQGFVLTYDGQSLRGVGRFHLQGGMDFQNDLGGSYPFDPTTAAGRSIRDRRAVHLYGDPAGFEADMPGAAQTARNAGVGAVVSVPLLRENQGIGCIVARRRDRRPYSDKQISLLLTFARQAVIAIENARSLQGMTEAVEQLMASAEVLRIVSEFSTSLDEVLEAVVLRSASLTDADRAIIFLLQGDQVLPVASTGADDLPELTHTLDRDRLADRALIEGQTVAFSGGVEAFLAEFPTSPIGAAGEGTARLAVPIRGTEGAIGALVFVRDRIDPFDARETALVETFADQAAIAIQNAHLFQEVEMKSRELEAASRAKSEFLSRMSHELRTPLNAIIGFAEIMEMDQITTARQHERVHHILQGGRHLLGLINEVLDITRIEAGRLSLSIEPVRLDAVVQEVLDLERPLAAGSDVTLELEEPDAFRVAIQADRQRLRQIVLNLVANAVKYNHPGGRVTLGCGAAAEGRIRLTVRDTGAGIPADQIGRLFAPFERLSAEASGVEGSGLGLAIARGLAEAMGGTIGAESVPDEGSTFWVELSAAATLPALPDREHLARSGDSDTPQGTATVLYIEDNQPNVDLVQDALQFRPGVTLLTAPDGATGIRIARRHRPDLILLDLNLPDLQGDDVLASLTADESTAAIPVVMVSADATQRQIDRLLAAGARAYLTKPLDVKRFLALVDEELDRALGLAQRTPTLSPEVRDESP